MSRDLEYDGRPELKRKRVLREIPVDSQETAAEAPKDTDLHQEATTALFTQLGRTYLKGEKLKEGLAAMEPADFIPVSPDAQKVKAAVVRLNDEASRNGKVITYKMYQQAINIMADKQWEVKRMYKIPKVPPDTETADAVVRREYNNGGLDVDNLIGAFLGGDPISGAILSGITGQTITSQGFLALTAVESITKGIFGTHYILAIIILIELGIEAARIIEMLGKAGNLPEGGADTIKEYEDPQKRREVLKENGFEPDKFYKSTELDDAITLIEYANNYIKGHSPEATTTYDHWIAYGNVAARQNLIRAALDTAPSYSRDFGDAFDRRRVKAEVTGGGVINDYHNDNPESPIHPLIATHVSGLNLDSSRTYDQILNTFMYQVQDEDLCCLVELFGSMDTDTLRLIAQLLRLVATDIMAIIARLTDGFLNALINLIFTGMFEIIAELNKLANDLNLKLLEVLEDLEESLGYELEHCPSFTDIQIGITFATNGILDKIDTFLRDALDASERLGRPDSGGWHIPAERRYLITTAYVMEVMADRIDAVSVCEQKDDKNKYEQLVGESKDAAAHEIIHTLLDKSPPSIQISDDDIRKYFPDLTPSTSPTYGFTFGPKGVLGDQVGRRGDALNTCGAEMTDERKTDIAKTISTALGNAFGRQDG